MTDFSNNYYIVNLIYSILMILLTFSVIESLSKNNIKIKNKFSYKKIDIIFLLKYLFLSFAIRILFEQIGIKFNLNVSGNDFDINVFTILVFILVNCIIAPITEEIVIRFGLFEWVKKYFNNFITIILVSLIFVFLHGYNFYASLMLLCLSLIWTFIYSKKSNLFYPIVLHFFHNLYVLIGFFNINNVFYIIFGIISFCFYIIFMLIQKEGSLITSQKKD